MQLAAGTVRRFSLLLATLNVGLPAANAVATVTANLPNGAFSAAEVTAGSGGIAVPIANVNSGLVIGPVTVTGTNTATFKVTNPGNVALNAVNASFELILFPGSGNQSVATGSFA